MNETLFPDWEHISAGVIRDEEGIPVEWTLLHLGENPIIRSGIPGVIHLTKEGMESILQYFRQKGELIPVDSHHFLHELASRKGLDEAEVLKMLPSGIAAMGFGSLFEQDGELRFRVQWNTLARTLLKEKIFRYFSPAIRGIKHGPLRITSVALENEPAINDLDALAASAENSCSSAQDAEYIQEGKENKMEQQEKVPEEIPEKPKIETPVPEKELAEELKELLKLGEEADRNVLLLTIRSLQEKANEADRISQELAKANEALNQFRQKEDERNKHDLLEQGIREGKITPATREWWEKLDTVQLSAHLPQAPVLIRQGAVERCLLTSDTGHLTAEDRAACRSFGFSESEYLNCKKNLK